jgi:hypothetical protein
MFSKAIFYAVSTLTLTGAGYAGLTIVAPDAAATIEAFVRDHGLGWPDSACRTNAIGCLNSRYDKLSELERSVEQSVGQIRGELGRVTAMVADQEMVAGKNAAFLDQGRAIYRERQDTPDQSITFANRTYPNLEVFGSQLELLFQEKLTLEGNLASARELQGKLKERLNALMVQFGQISLAKKMVPAQLQLIKANKTLADFGTNVTMIDGLIRGSEAGLGETEQLIRTTRDMIAPSKNPGSVVPQKTNEAFQKFLHG